MDADLNDWSESEDYEGVGNGNRLVTPLKSLMEVFEDALPYYLKMGMTYDQYWNGDVSAHRAYRKAEKLKQKDLNQVAWLQVMYFYEALMDAAPAIKAFCKQRAKPYRNAPYDFDEEERKEREERERRKRYKHIKERVAMFAEAFNKKKTETPERKGDSITDG